MRNASILALLAVAYVASPVVAAIATFQQGVSAYTGTTNANILKVIPTTAIPGAAQVGTFNPGLPRVPLLRFNTSSIAGSYSQINSISLRFTSNGNFSFPISVPVTWSLYEVTTANKDWTANATWEKKVGLIAWAGTDGGSTSATDYVASPAATLSFTYDGVPANIPTLWTWNFSGSPAALLALVNQWSGVQSSNAGLFLRLDDETQNGRYLDLFGTAATTPSDRPLLTINYSIPEPAGLALVAAGTLMGLHRRTKGQVKRL